MDVSQTIEMVGGERAGLSAYITGSSRLFHTGKVRMVLGVERLAMQSIYYPADVAEKLLDEDDELLCNLAGNAFEGRCMAAAFLSLLLLAARSEAGGPARNYESNH